MSFKFRQKPTLFRYKFMITKEIPRLGLFLRAVHYITDKKDVKSIGFVFPILPFSVDARDTLLVTQSLMATRGWGSYGSLWVPLGPLWYSCIVASRRLMLICGGNTLHRLVPFAVKSTPYPKSNI